MSKSKDGLTADQRKALRDLGAPYHYQVNWRHGLSPEEYRDLRDKKLIEEAWTWLSTTRPDVAITDAGAALRTPANGG